MRDLSRATNEALLRNVPLFATIPSGELAELAVTFETISYSAGSILVAEGQRDDRVYIVLSGLFEIVKELGTREEYQLGLRGAGEFVGEMSLLNQDGLRTASARAVADSLVIELTSADFQRLLQRYPMIAYDLLRVLSTRLRDANDTAVHDLEEKNRQLERAYANLQEQNQQLALAYAELAAAQAQLVEKEALERELRLAREIQESSLPHHLPQQPELEVGARMVAAREVGGDFFDVIALSSGALGLVVADVSGKGMPAAIFMALTRSLLRAEASRDNAPETTLRNVNRHLLDMNASGMFVTVLYGIFHADTGEFSYARAGHDLPLVWHASGEPQPVTRAIGHPLALLPDPALDVQVVHLPPGATLLLYTDGVTEATDARGDFFGMERLQATVREQLGTPAQQLCDWMVEVLALYRGAAPQADDITLLAVRRLPSSPA